MIHSERTREIDATPEEVWAVLGRFMHIDEFHPAVASVDPLTTETEGVGAKRHCDFTDGTSVDEEVVSWEPNHMYRVRMTEFSMPLKEAFAELSVEPLGEGRARAKMAMEFQPKYGPIGWLMGQTMIKMMTRKIFDVTLRALDRQVHANRS